jgi:hypothetical protein
MCAHRWAWQCRRSGSITASPAQQSCDSISSRLWLLSVSCERYSTEGEKVSPAAAIRMRGIALGLLKTRAQFQSVHERNVYGIGTINSYDGCVEGCACLHQDIITKSRSHTWGTLTLDLDIAPTAFHHSLLHHISHPSYSPYYHLESSTDQYSLSYTSPHANFFLVSLLLHHIPI